MHTHLPELGRRKFKIGREVWIERGDYEETPPKGFFRLFPGNKVRLKYGHVVECTGCSRNADGSVAQVHALLVPDGTIPQPTPLLFQTPFGAVSLPLWIVLVILGREAFMTVFRQVAARRGLVISAIGPAKWKTTFQSLWQGAAYCWFFAATLAAREGWESDGAWKAFAYFNGVVGVTHNQDLYGTMGVSCYYLEVENVTCTDCSWGGACRLQTLGAPAPGHNCTSQSPAHAA